MFCSNWDARNPFASATQTAALLRSGAQYHRDRMEAADMITTIEAAAPAGGSRVTIYSWIKSGRYVGMSNPCAAASSCRAGSSSPDSLPGDSNPENWLVQLTVDAASRSG